MQIIEVKMFLLFKFYFQKKGPYVKTFKGIKNKLREFAFKEYVTVFRIGFAKAVYIAASRVFFRCYNRMLLF